MRIMDDTLPFSLERSLAQFLLSASRWNREIDPPVYTPAIDWLRNQSIDEFRYLTIASSSLSDLPMG